MLNVQPDVYAVGSGQGVWAGRDAPFAAIAASLDLIAAAGDGGWVKLNTNEYSEIWPATNTFGPSFGTPRAVINAWSGFAWDASRHNLYLWGGGHANTDDSALYQFDLKTRQWKIGFYSQEAVQADPAGPWEVKDGWQHGPMSSHTYGNNTFLPTLDRFLTLGGAAHQQGGRFQGWDGGATRNLLGGYFCDMTLVGQGYVGGSEGSNWVRAGDPRDLPGASPWQCLDYGTTNPGWPAYDHIQGGIADVRQEAGVDVVYIMSSTTTVKNLERVVMPSTDPSTHSYSRVGRTFSTAVGGDVGVASDRSADVVLMVGRLGMGFWDLKTAGATNNLQAVTITGDDAAEFESVIRPDVANRNPGLAAMPSGGLYAWNEGGEVFRITPPAGSPTPASGWLVERVDAAGSTRPMTRAEILADNINASSSGGVLGKWRWADDLRCFVALEHAVRGNVWAFRPPGWTDPRG